MRACVFVDGANFHYSVRDLFSNEFFWRRYFHKNSRWGEFFDEIVSRSSNGEARRVRTYWYVNAEVDFVPSLPTIWQESNDREKVEAWIRQNRHHINKSGLSEEKALAAFRNRRDIYAEGFYNFRQMQRRIESSHRAVEFRRSGARSYQLCKASPEDALGKEKTVDVNLSMDMWQMRDIYDIAVIVSGDQDYLPAVQAVKNAGKTVVNVAFAKKSGALLPGGAKRLNEATDDRLTIDYAKFAEFLGLSAKKGEGK